MTRSTPVPEPLRCAGSPREAGRVQGEAWREGIDRSWSILHELEAFRLMRPWFLPWAAFAWLASRKASATWMDAVAPKDPDTHAWLSGVAEGARVPLRRLALLNLMEPLLAELGDMTEDSGGEARLGAPLGACSAVAVRGDAAQGGAPLLGRNFDYLEAVQPLYRMRDCRPDSGFRALEFTLAPLAGAIDGMNEHGLTIAYDYAFATDGGRPAPTISAAIHAALTSCRNVAEAIEFFASRARWGGGLLMLADPEGDIASLELSSTRHAARSPAQAEDRLTHSNCYQSDACRGVELSRTATYTNAAPTTLRGGRVHRSGEARQERLVALTRDAGPFDAAGVKRILADHGEAATGSSDTICMHSDYWTTTASLVFHPRERRVEVAFASACADAYVEFGL